MRKGMRKDNTAFTYALAAMTWLKVVPDKVLLRAATPAAWQRVRKEAQGALAPEHMACRLFGAAELAELAVRAIVSSLDTCPGSSLAMSSHVSVPTQTFIQFPRNRSGIRTRTLDSPVPLLSSCSPWQPTTNGSRLARA